MTLCRCAREALGWTQDQLAHAIGVHPLTVSKWERGRLEPSPYQESLLRRIRYAAGRDPALGARAAAVLADEGPIRALYELLHACYQRD